MIPLEKTVLYQADRYLTGIYPWEHNSTEWTINIRGLVHTGNQLNQLKLENLAPKLEGAHIGKERSRYHVLSRRPTMADV